MPAVTRRAGARPTQPGANAAGGAEGAPNKVTDAGADALDGSLALPLPLPSPQLPNVASGALPQEERAPPVGQQQPRRRQQSKWGVILAWIGASGRGAQWFRPQSSSGQ